VIEDMDEAFKALADDSRRALLDALHERDGQSLHELCAVRSEMSRFGVMEHLRILDGAHLVLTERSGRNKLHHLNPGPISELHDRWIAPYREPIVAGLLALRDLAEGATA